MTRAVVVAAAVAAGVLAASGCGVTPDLQTRPVAVSFPTHVVPSSLRGMTATVEPSAQQAFAEIGANSAVARGQVWTLRQDGIVVGSVQVSQLKGGLTTQSERIRQGIRKAVNDVPFRWFKVRGHQWVGVQTAPQLFLYLWMPPRRDLYTILTLKSTVIDPEQVVADLIAYEESGS
jgi:hypothetical protein